MPRPDLDRLNTTWAAARAQLCRDGRGRPPRTGPNYAVTGEGGRPVAGDFPQGSRTGSRPGAINLLDDYTQCGIRQLYFN